MQILFLSTWFPSPPDNGSKIRVKHLVQALASKHAVTLASFSFGAVEQEEADALGCKVIRTIEVNPFVENQAGALRTFVSCAPAAYRPIPSMQRLVDELLDQESYDLVIASTELMATYALQAESRMKKILEEHNSLTRQMYERYDGSCGLMAIRNKLSYEKMRRYEGKLFNQFDKVVMVSAEDKRTSETELPGLIGSVGLIPNGVDCLNNQPGLAEKRTHQLIFNGSLTYDANYDAMEYFLASIYPRVRQKIPTTRLLITGSTVGVELMGLALDASVELTGYVKDIRLPVAEATACVVPLRKGGGTRLKILEAMALGTAVVASSKGAEGLEVIEGEHLLLADTPREFARSVVVLLNDPALRQELTRNARRLVEEKYDWRRIGAEFLNLVETTAFSDSAD